MVQRCREFKRSIHYMVAGCIEDDIKHSKYIVG